MSERATIALGALVDPTEQAGVIVAAEQLSDCLGRAAGGEAWPVRLHFHASVDEVVAAPAASALIISLAPEARLVSEPIGQTEARWRTGLTRLIETGGPVFVCTVFRHVAERANTGAPSPVLERIRRVNRMVADLSHDLGVAVIDIDRALAHVGGRTLQADYRQGSLIAAEIAGHTAAWSLLSYGLDDIIDPDLQEKAKAVLGDIKSIHAVVERRLALRKTRQATAPKAAG